ncbi:hypothetical protein MXD61_05400 [Frankia sp. AgPm24]|uniref:SRPBCC family protein n=1 Tax=Frankia sp. AgPm24 TaxID=631128 RepID=UPI00200EB983|nr:SRPBCC family protein [Frankia sp. AgPm24]MCK9921337.1 hypothetical protein [Frankia sp. AgPm24]
MLETVLEVSIAIPLPVSQVHTFMTTPDNWAAASPVTERIQGDRTDRPVTLGASFVDVLRLGPDITAEVRWTVTRDDPGSTWQITCEPAAGTDPADGHIHVTLTYSYSRARHPLDVQHPRGSAAGTEPRAEQSVGTPAEVQYVADATLLTRTVRTAYTGEANLPLPYRDVFTNRTIAARFLAAMRSAMLASDHVPTGAASRISSAG